jgi:cellulose synthase/poly-beta-1,6-N-acetylglucosamine synthase-like glycosyltransferase
MMQNVGISFTDVKNSNGKNNMNQNQIQIIKNNNFAKVLVAAPIYENMEYCFKEFIEAISKIDYTNYNILLVDNSKTQDFYNKLKNLEKTGRIKVLYDKTKEEKNLFRLISSRNKILKYAKENNYDYLLMMDADVIAPKNIITDLMSHKKDIISGIYLRAEMRNNKNVAIPNALVLIDKLEGKELFRSLSFYEMYSNNLFEVLFCSGGCMLLSRDAFTKLKYGYLGFGADDNYFMKTAKDNGFKLYCYPHVFCDHIIGKNKFKDGKWHLEI